MRARVVVTLAVAVLLAGIPAFGAPAAAKKKKKAGPVVVATDDPADWGDNFDPNVNPLGGPLGQELVEASIVMADKTTVNFIIKVAALPPTGGIPESSRYNWDMIVDGDHFQLSGAFTEFIRGVCNPLHTNACPPPQNPGLQPFFVRQGACSVGSECHVVAVVHATFDPASATITIPVTLEIFDAKPGAKIEPSSSAFGGGIYAAPAALVTSASFPIDHMIVEKTFVVPK